MARPILGALDDPNAMLVKGIQHPDDARRAIDRLPGAVHVLRSLLADLITGADGYPSLEDLTQDASWRVP